MLSRLLIAAASLTVASAGDYEPIILPRIAGKDGPSKLLLFVPGGAVPIEDYKPFVAGTMQYCTTSLVAAIVHCGKLNLCDPLGQLDGLIADAIRAAATASNTTFAPSDIFVMGHSLGGVGARYYAETFDRSVGAAAFAGVALFGTQFNGDHTDFKGTLGYPLDLKRFPSPLLVLLGELDKDPTSHAALLYSQYEIKLTATERAKKPVVIVAGMDHSQFCSPFKVPGDLKPEISNEVATYYASRATAAWVDVLTSSSPAVVNASSAVLSDWATNSSAPITRAWRQAHALEAGAVCAQAQRVVLADLPRADVDKVDVEVSTVGGSAELEHTHTNFSLAPRGGALAARIVSYPYYPQVSSWNPVDVIAPTYSGAKDISCKLLSADRVAEQLDVKGAFPQRKPPVSCSHVNRAVFDDALSSLAASWPAALRRFESRGRNLTFADDSSTFAGPQWVFASALKFDEKHATVSSPRLYSSITSHIYPGNMYCKVLSPAKALEWVQTTGLVGRF